MALKGRNKFRFVNGSLPVQDSTHPDYARWHRVNNIVMSWIPHSIYRSLAYTILYAKDAAIVWVDVKSRFSTVNGLHIYELECHIGMLYQNDASAELIITSFENIGIN